MMSRRHNILSDIADTAVHGAKYGQALTALTECILMSFAYAAVNQRLLHALQPCSLR